MFGQHIKLILDRIRTRLKTLPTEFAPAERALDEDIVRQTGYFTDVPHLQQFIDGAHDIFVILNTERQIVFTNQALLDFIQLEERADVYGRRPGEALDCIHAIETSGGCGTTEFCSTCGAVNAILTSQRMHKACEECRITRQGGEGPLDLGVWATPLTVMPEPFTIFSAVDISHEKRRWILERIFFHDILNTAGGIRGFAELLWDSEPEEIEQFRDMVHRLADRLIDEIKSHRELVAAERNELAVSLNPINSADIINEIIDLYVNHEVAEGRHLEVASDSAEAVIVTDTSILSRVLGNMVKNALEASQPGESITIGCKELNGEITFWVHNPAFMPRDVQLQIFQRSFSTKGAGRGLGTYSIKLLTENYLKGRISFRSSEDEGTVFEACYPRELEKEKE